MKFDAVTAALESLHAEGNQMQVLLTEAKNYNEDAFVQLRSALGSEVWGTGVIVRDLSPLCTFVHTNGGTEKVFHDSYSVGKVSNGNQSVCKIGCYGIHTEHPSC